MPPKKSKVVAKKPAGKPKATRARKLAASSKGRKQSSRSSSSSSTSSSSLSPNTRANTKANSLTKPTPNDLNLSSDSSSDEEPRRSRDRESNKGRMGSASSASVRTAMSKSSAGRTSDVFKSPSRSRSSSSSDTKSKGSSSSSRSSSASSQSSASSSSSSSSSNAGKRSNGSRGRKTKKAAKPAKRPVGKRRAPSAKVQRSRYSSAASRRSATETPVQPNVQYHTFNHSNNLPPAFWQGMQQMMSPHIGSQFGGTSPLNVSRKTMTPKPSYNSRTKRAKLVLQIPRIRHQMKRERPGKRIGHRTAVAVGAITEYILQELLEMSADAAGMLKKKRISPKCLNMAIKTDEELAYLFKNDIIAGGGYVKTFY
ncbi:unnamed protein product [Bursaphelenchus okinawaensis]|uniref:Core Histone H2A/H2B/H3 domain-containing protein n=1 Tax=Bursaphelenchus okinawaensis TaxID=465554 RepID=A0A811JSK3_9BILA|nr:unnamed protein product [Bursaphelenchus okinawaensis]CAG9080618.1 unnamed protein product [Bursaphelenchus okinawaensis]